MSAQCMNSLAQATIPMCVYDNATYYKYFVVSFFNLSGQKLFRLILATPLTMRVFIGVFLHLSEKVVCGNGLKQQGGESSIEGVVVTADGDRNGLWRMSILLG